MDNHISAELQAEIDKARVAGEAMEETEPRAVKAWYAADADRIFMELNTEIIMGFPCRMLQGLNNATPEQLADVEVTPSGYGLHWESLDVDLGVPQLVAGLFGTKAWMAELGRLAEPARMRRFPTPRRLVLALAVARNERHPKGGKSRSGAKAQASRDNGKHGGRPRKPC